MYSDMVKRSMGTERGSAKEEISEPKVGTFEKYTKGVGRKIMEKQGWSEGRGLGNGRKEGRKHAIEAKGQVSSCKHGVGYKEEQTDVEDNERDEDEWVKGNGPTRRSASPQEIHVETSNRYSPLFGEEVEEEKEQECFMFKRRHTESKGDAKRRRKALKETAESEGEEERSKEEKEATGEEKKEMLDEAEQAPSAQASSNEQALWDALPMEERTEDDNWVGKEKEHGNKMEEEEKASTNGMRRESGAKIIANPSLIPNHIVYLSLQYPIQTMQSTPRLTFSFSIFK